MEAFRVFSRRGCHLCELLIEELATLVAGRVPISVIDIDEDPVLKARYDLRVPVLAFGDAELCDYRLDAEAVRRILEVAE